MVSRRHFVAVFAKSVAVIFGAGVGLSRCISQIVVRGQRRKDGLWVGQQTLRGLRKPSDVVAVQTREDDAPIFLRRISGEKYLAVSSICTHQGCRLTADPDGYTCPCHGSQFDLRGQVLRGPADVSLPQFSTLVRSDGLLIQLNP